jgi:hypothetical protein
MVRSADAVLRLAQSPRLTSLDRLRGDPNKLEFYVCLDAGQLSSHEILRRFEGLLDSLESFYSDQTIDLKISCNRELQKELERGLPKTPKSAIHFVEKRYNRKPFNNLSNLIEDAALKRIFSAILIAAEGSGLTLAMTLETFPIRPFSVETLVTCCHELSWLDPLPSSPSCGRTQLLTGPALFERHLAVSILAELMIRNDELAHMPVSKRHAAIADEFARAELGFWAPQARQSLPPPLIFRTRIENLTWPWVPQPWKTDAAPYFLWLEGSFEADGELVLQRVYDTIHR